MDWELGKIKVFLLAGRIASGKSTVAKYLKAGLGTEYPSAIIRIDGFARHVKDVARDSFGWDGNKDAKGRRLLQVVGTDAGREYDSDIWVRRAFESVCGYMPPNIIIFDDWRFPNEYEYWKGNQDGAELIGDVYKIIVFREEEKFSDHLSEKSLPSIELVLTPDYYDYRFDNNGTENQILAKVREMLEALL